MGRSVGLVVGCGGVRSAGCHEVQPSPQVPAQSLPNRSATIEHLYRRMPTAVTCVEPDLHERIETLLHDPSRVNVMHSFSLHNFVAVDGGVRIHLILKFK